jgi:NAD+ synthase (glutamine-hydrolysing)
MKIALAQINPTVGHLSHNAQKMLEFCHAAAKRGASLVIFPELSLTGYPPKDLLLNAGFLKNCDEELGKFAASTPLPAIVGAPNVCPQGDLFNSAVFCRTQGVKEIGRKVLLPNFMVFDEKRYFKSPADPTCQVLFFEGQKILVSICEDGWASFNRHRLDPIERAFKAHPDIDLIVNLSASPFTGDAHHRREEVFTEVAKRFRRPTLVCNQVGGNDQLLFDGSSLVINAQGEIESRGRFCEEDLLIFGEAPQLAPEPSALEKLRQAIVLGIRDYARKCGQPGFVIGLSGGIDSAVVATLAVEAVGAENVVAYYLPSQYSQVSSQIDAQALAQNLGIAFNELSIEGAASHLRELIGPQIMDAPVLAKDLTDQNLQARLRGLLLMAFCNASGKMLLATSNKSELAVGYTTIYGDLCGAVAPIGDLYKTKVQELAQHINQKTPIIPPNIIHKAPSAELKMNQKDADTLPPYPNLDRILMGLIIQKDSVAEVAHHTDLPASLVQKVATLMSNAEHKRRQAPLSLMLSEQVFGEGWRMPIAKNWAG